MTTPAVVEKQVIDIELKSGHDESERAERIDWTKKLTTVENLVLDDYGVLVKRPGTTTLASYNDDASAAAYPPRRACTLQDGFAYIGGPVQKLYHYEEQRGIMVNKGGMPEFGQTITPLGNNGLGSSLGGTAGYVQTAMTDRYKIGLFNAGATNYALVVLDKDSSNQVRLYQTQELVKSGALTAGFSTIIAFMTVVADRYIHVWLDTNAGVGQFFFQIDTQALPADLSAVTCLTPTNAAAAKTMVGVVPSPGGSTSFMLFRDGTANLHVSEYSVTPAEVGTSGAISLAGVTGTATDLCMYSTTMLVVGTSTVATDYRVWKLDCSTATPTLASTVSDAAPSGTRRSLPMIACNTAGTYYVVASSLEQMGGGTLGAPATDVFKATAAAVTFTDVGSLPGWGTFMAPFYNSITDRFYGCFCQAAKSHSGATTATETVGPAVIADITNSLFVTPTADYGTTGDRFRPVVVMDAYTAATNGMAGNGPPATAVTKPFIRSTSQLCVGLSSQITATAFGYTHHELKVNSIKGVSCADDIFSGAAVYQYDGNEVSELGFVDRPIICISDAGGGVLAAGLRSYVAVFEFVDSSGKAHFSRTSAVSSFTSAGNANNVQVTLPCLSAHMADKAKTEGRVLVKIYRTTSGGTTYYLLATKDMPAFGGSRYFTDTLADATSDTTLAARPIMHRQPGVANTALDRYYAPACSHICRHKDRVFVCRGSNVYYSSFAVDGEAPWFNPNFFIAVPGGTGDITGLASMDGMLVVFKRDGVWLIDGDGPPENGGTGAEFSAPRRIMTEFGCVDPRTIVATSDGVLYRSSRGIEMLNRSLQVVWVGQKVQDTVDAYPLSGGAAYDRKNSRVLFVLGAVEGTYEGELSYAENGVVVVLDTTSGGWVVWKLTNTGGNFGKAMQDVCVSKLNISGVQSDEVIFIDNYRGIARQYDTNSLDVDGATYFVPYVIETGWIKTASTQDRIRVSDFLFLGKKRSNHNVKVSVAYDYSDTYTHSRVFTPADLYTIEQIEFQVPRQAVQAVRFKIEDSAPADTTAYPVTTGKGADVLALSVKVGQRGGGAKLSSSQKG